MLYLDVSSIEAQVTCLQCIIVFLISVGGGWLAAAFIIIRHVTTLAMACRLATRTPRPMRFDPVSDYRRALAAMLAWEETANTTGNRRHVTTAAICREIAIERLRDALASGITADAKRELLQASGAILDVGAAGAGRADIAELRFQLAGMEPLAPAPPSAPLASEAKLR
jgi:hypothetical protein